jgi:argininosuccinate synthase
MPQNVKKVVLAYSGRLDTSIILKWFQQTYRAEVVTFTADLGQGEELGPRATRRCCSVRSWPLADIRPPLINVCF